ncbi:alpha/beta fold hydrolase [Prauserella rugosa]|uniref:Pimeloyl-ACP methyl ester carboxylesterase n=1 Tax=Prauserella rugosa TaxID=43354 RepID=A0A660CAC9_9PSEU|nr:alpha/beta hydrolase [Prauserella rugosa]KMS90417.1 alpha/beta hydrolase [Streptomyces regensis]TWH20266.1 pimeloyl-ACP methyl ester carboxylesterase [Prauserella rugosa]
MSVFTAEHRNPTGDRPLVVFMSALFAGKWIWDHPFTELDRAGHPVLRINEAICAVEPKVAGSIERLGDELLAACDEAGARDVVVCANSLGGLVAIDLAGRCPERVRGIVVSGAPGLSTEPDVGLSMDRRGSVKLASDQFRERMLAALFHGEPLFTEQQIQETGELLGTGSAMVAMARSLRATRTYAVPAGLDKVQCPSLYVWGAHDRMTPVDPWAELVAEQDRAEFVTVAECGHIPMVERRETYTGHLVRFLDRVAP